MRELNKYKKKKLKVKSQVEVLALYVLSDNEIRVLEKGLDFAPIQRKINEPKFRSDFGEFRRRMRIK